MNQIQTKKTPLKIDWVLFISGALIMVQFLYLMPTFFEFWIPFALTLIFWGFAFLGPYRKLYTIPFLVLALSPAIAVIIWFGFAFSSYMKDVNGNPNLRIALPQVIPDKIVLEIDAQTGIELEKIGGKFTAQIPDSGILKIKPSADYSRWDQARIINTKGERLRARSKSIDRNPNDRFCEELPKWKPSLADPFRKVMIESCGPLPNEEGTRYVWVIDQSKE